MPDYKHLVQEFYWQTDDVPPELRRTHLFLNYWHDHIEAIIKDVLIWQPKHHDWRRIDWSYDV